MVCALRARPRSAVDSDPKKRESRLLQSDCRICWSRRAACESHQRYGFASTEAALSALRLRTQTTPRDGRLIGLTKAARWTAEHLEEVTWREVCLVVSVHHSRLRGSAPIRLKG